MKTILNLIKAAIQAYRIRTARIVLVVPEFKAVHLCKTWHECDAWINCYPQETYMFVQ